MLSYILGRFLPKLGGALCAAFFLFKARGNWYFRS
jgi:hypothetical protein